MALTKHLMPPLRLPSCCACTLIAALAFVLTGCGEEPTPEASAPPTPVATEKPTFYNLTWLRQIDPTPAEQWLASREVGHDLDLYDPAVTKMREKLDTASKRFRDHPRMIANRAVQLEGMLQEKKIAERAPEIIDTLCEVQLSGRSVESFSSLTQQYYNLRMEGLDRDKAIVALRQQNP
ncbi:hypothetical protein [Hyphomicrobium sulfonivorans]|nr:hypothetical protein [Hyphomicrobium sulfonivorans]